MVNVDMCEHYWPGSGCKECKEEGDLLKEFQELTPAIEILLSEIDESHANQLVKGTKKLENSTIPGNVVLKMIKKALSSHLFQKEINVEYSTAAYQEALDRYPESISGLIFYKTALGLNEGEITPEVMKWVDQVISSSPKSEITATSLDFNFPNPFDINHGPWQPIETSPTDDSKFMIGMWVGRVVWVEELNKNIFTSTPTWMQCVSHRENPEGPHLTRGWNHRNGPLCGNAKYWAPLHKPPVFDGDTIESLSKLSPEKYEKLLNIVVG